MLARCSGFSCGHRCQFSDILCRARRGWSFLLSTGRTQLAVHKNVQYIHLYWSVTKASWQPGTLKNLANTRVVSIKPLEYNRKSNFSQSWRDASDSCIAALL